MKRIICLMPGVFLAAALLGGAGEAVPIPIWNLQELDDIRFNPGGDYVLMRDLDFNDDDSYNQAYIDWAAKKTAWTDGDGWEPIGMGGMPFFGIFDGNGRMISGLFMNRPWTVWPDMKVGLFGYVHSEGTVKNVGLLGVDITGSEDVGGLVGDNRGTVENSYAVGSITGGFSTGGLVGYNRGTVANSYADGSAGGVMFTGGLVGWNHGGTVINSHAAGSVTGDTTVGGLVGDNDGGLVANSYASGSVSGAFGSSQLGGLVGDNNGGLVANSYASGSVSGDSFIGGLAGVNAGGIFYSYSTGSVTGNTNVGGLIGSNTGTVEDSFYDSETSGRGDIGKGEPRDTAQMKDIATFTGAGWDIQASGTDLNDGYPYLGWQSGGNPPVWNIFDASFRPPRRRPGRPGPVITPPPPPPGGFGVSPLEGLPLTNRLWWDEAAGGKISKYRLYVSTEWTAGAAAEAMDAAGLMFRLLDEVPGDVFEYMHAGLTPGIRYYYVIVSVDEAGAESRITSSVLWAIAGTGETGEYAPVSWGPGRITDGAGSLSADINPYSVREAARWRRVGTGAWLESGREEADVPAGPHVIEFSEVAGWEKPADIRVSVNPGIATRVTGVYMKAAGVPGAVELISPEGAQGSLDLTYMWRWDGDAEWYRLWINRGGVNTWDKWYEVGKDVLPRDGVVGVELPGHRPGAGYEWWVQAWSPSGPGPWSGGMRFDTAAGHRLEWGAIGGATWYELYLNLEGRFFHREWVRMKTEWTGALPPGAYRWWVQPWGPETGYGAWLPQGDFAVE